MKNLFTYLLNKKSEFAELEAKDALLAKTILDIHRKRTHSSFVIVPLFSINQVHAIDHENAIKDTRRRIKTLQQKKKLLLDKKKITKEHLSEILPSISAVKVVKQSDHSYIAFEGNGRLVALQNTFSSQDEIMIEVEEYHFKDTRKILRRMERVRRLNGLKE